MGGFTGARRRAIAAVIALGVSGIGVVASQTEAGATPSAVRLHLGTDFQAFTFGTTTQSLTTQRNSCVVSGPSGTLMALSTNGSQAAPGLANYGLGIKAAPSSGNGSPCAQIDGTELLRLRPGTQLTGRTFSKMQLDLEMTGNAVVLVTASLGSTSRQFRMQTGTSITAPISDTTPPYEVTSTDPATPVACAAPNSSGPNSASNDNCVWTIDPDIDFDTVTITTTTAGATASLEGSGDFGNSPTFDTMFFLSNAVPVAGNDSATTPEDTPVDINVLANDSDGDAQPLTVAIQTPPTRGTLTPTATNGVFTYTPNANVNGSDSFVYSVTDGSASATANVSITVVPVNDPPVAQDASVSADEDGAAVTIPVATDIDSSVVNASCSGVTGGTVTNIGNGSITFIPAPNFNGSVTFTCTITDAQGATATATATVNVGVVPVNDAPVAVDDAYDVPEQTTETPFVTLNVVSNDTDVDLDTLTATAVTDPTNGTAEVVAGGIRYTPDLGFRGTDTLTYTVSDGGLTDTATVTLTVFPVICSAQTVSDTDGAVSGTFTRLTDSQVCKRYVLDADATTGTVLFTPQGAFDVAYRGTLNFGPRLAPTGTGELSLLLEYDPLGGTAFRPVRWCVDPVFDPSGVVTSATLPVGETWCVASEATTGVAGGQVQTIWQVYGVDDPNFFAR